MSTGLQVDREAPSALDLVKLAPLMNITEGRPDITIGLIDGPVALDHPDFASCTIREVSGRRAGACANADTSACLHGTFVAGILCAKRGSNAPGICPMCTLLVRPIFGDARPTNGEGLSTTPEELAAAIVETVDAGARVVNVSASMAAPSSSGHRELDQALDYAASRNVILAAAAGNQGTVGSSTITRHPWVIPVVACDRQGRPLNQTNLGHSIGRRGLSAPGEGIRSLALGGAIPTLGGTSAATPFVTGATALVWSAFPHASAVEIRSAVTHGSPARRTTIVPPLLDAWAAYQRVASAHSSSLDEQRRFEHAELAGIFSRSRIVGGTRVL